MTLLFVALLALALAAGAYFYFQYINRKMTETAAITNKAAAVAAATGAARFWARLQGWKTPILAWGAAAMSFLVQIPALISAALSYCDEDLLRAWQGAPWASIIDAKVANWITFGLAVAIPITHCLGLNKAAKVVPSTTSAEV